MSAASHPTHSQRARMSGPPVRALPRVAGSGRDQASGRRVRAFRIWRVMPRIEKRWRLPQGVRDHGIERMRDRKISLDDLNQLRLWLETRPEVPGRAVVQRFWVVQTLWGRIAAPRRFYLRARLQKDGRFRLRHLAHTTNTALCGAPAASAGEIRGVSAPSHPTHSQKTRMSGPPVQPPASFPR